MSSSTDHLLWVNWYLITSIRFSQVSKHIPGYTHPFESLALGNLMFLDIYLSVKQDESCLSLIEVRDNSLYC